MAINLLFPSPYAYATVTHTSITVVIYLYVPRHSLGRINRKTSSACSFLLLLYPRLVLLIEVVEIDFSSRRLDLAFEHTTWNRTSFVTC